VTVGGQSIQLVPGPVCDKPRIGPICLQAIYSVTSVSTRLQVCASSMIEGQFFNEILVFIQTLQMQRLLKIVNFCGSQCSVMFTCCQRYCVHFAVSEVE